MRKDDRDLLSCEASEIEERQEAKKIEAKFGDGEGRGGFNSRATFRYMEIQSLTDEEREGLIPKMLAGDMEARSRIMEDLIPLIRSRISDRLPDEVFDEHFQAAVLHVMERIDTYDPDKGPLNPYVIMLARNGVHQAMADEAGVPLHVQRWKTLIWRAEEELFRELNREPSITEVAARAFPAEFVNNPERTRRKVAGIRETPAEGGSLDEDLDLEDGGDGDEGSSFHDITADPDAVSDEDVLDGIDLQRAIEDTILDGIDNERALVDLQEATGELTEQQAAALSLLFGLDGKGEHTHREAQAEMGVSSVHYHVKGALKRLQAALDGEPMRPVQKTRKASGPLDLLNPTLERIESNRERGVGTYRPRKPRTIPKGKEAQAWAKLRKNLKPEDIQPPAAKRRKSRSTRTVEGPRPEGNRSTPWECFGEVAEDGWMPEGPGAAVDPVRLSCPAPPTLFEGPRVHVFSVNVEGVQRIIDELDAEEARRPKSPAAPRPRRRLSPMGKGEAYSPTGPGSDRDYYNWARKDQRGKRHLRTSLADAVAGQFWKGWSRECTYSDGSVGIGKERRYTPEEVEAYCRERGYEAGGGSNDGDA